MSQLLEYTLEQLDSLGSISSKSMFGGHGIYRNKIIFAIIADEELYFKVTEANIKDFEETDSKPFTYSKKNGKQAVMSYWLVPIDVLESQEELLKWAHKSYLASKAKVSI